ncbi:NTP transferase domain-containing protein [Curtobacterium albidum]|uniref:NTP transferase domain-containing protein n=1 Tax=Curtobacterium citreum TaxID=2036 RepID=A0A850DTA3_9MICO|nr:NTP transferase domain-containing protein [Curtobacterium albidum]NUU27758.1 NTP transferase domain-containing protein [Curtobacterium albidum]
MVEPASVEHDAVLLAGGRASRMSGIDKTALVADGLALSDHAVAAAARARSVVLVGLRDGRTAPDGVVVTREDPPFGGPVAGIAAGLVAVPEPAPWTLVLACDLVRPERAVDALLRAADDTADVDGFVAVDEDGRRQPLLALYRSSALREAVQALGDPTDAAVRRLTAGLRLVEVLLAAGLCADVDEPADAARVTGTSGLLD